MYNMNFVQIMEKLNISYLENILFEKLQINKELCQTKLECKIEGSQGVLVKKYVDGIIKENKKEYNEWISMVKCPCIQKIYIYHPDTQKRYIKFYTVVNKNNLKNAYTKNYYVGKYDDGDYDSDEEYTLSEELNNLREVTKEDFKNLLLYLTLNNMIFKVDYETVRIN